MFDQQDKWEYKDVDLDLDEYLARVQSKSTAEKQGILVLPTENWRQTGVTVFMPETFSFVKWVKQNNANSNRVSVVSLEENKIADLRSADFWIPLAYLFSDTSLQIYLNIVASYLYDRMRGVLQGEKRIVDLEVLIEDKKAGRTKRFTYHGSYDGLKEIIKKIDINEFVGK